MLKFFNCGICSLEEQHQNEIQTYREDSEKWRQEVSNLKILISKHRSTSGQPTIDNFNRLLKEKDDRIHELSVLLRQIKVSYVVLIDIASINRVN